MAMIQNGKRTDAYSPTELDRDIAPVLASPVDWVVLQGVRRSASGGYYTPSYPPCQGVHFD